MKKLKKILLGIIAGVGMLATYPKNNIITFAAEDTTTINAGTYTWKDNLYTENITNFGGAIFDFTSNNITYNRIVAYYLPSKTNYVLSYENDDGKQTILYDETIFKENQIFIVEEDKTITNSKFITFLNNNSTYVAPPQPEPLKLTNLFTELATGLTSLATCFVATFTGLAPIFYNDGLTIVSIFLIGGVALTIGFWAIDKIFGLAKMGLGGLGKARAKKSKRGS